MSIGNSGADERGEGLSDADNLHQEAPPEAEASPPVVKQLLVESDPHQTRAAVLEDGKLTEIYLERTRKR